MKKRPEFLIGGEHGPTGPMTLTPLDRDHIFDTVNGCYLDDNPGEFTIAMHPERGEWQIFIQVGGEQQHLRAASYVEMREVVKAWYWRRFRYADEPRPNNNR